MNLKPSLIAVPAAFLMTILVLVAIYPSRAAVSAPTAPTRNGLTVTDLAPIIVTPTAG